jgi:hypothetical protein
MRDTFPVNALPKASQFLIIACYTASGDESILVQIPGFRYLRWATTAPLSVGGSGRS